MISTPAVTGAPAAPAGTPILKRLVSFSAVLAALLAALAVLTVRSRLVDPDLWWHLRTGQIIWTTHHIPQADFFSYSTNHHPYIPHEWLSQILIYAAYAAHGYSGLMLWECGFTAAILLAAFYLCTIYSGNAKLGFVGAIVIWLFGTVGFAVRPQMVGYLLLVFELIVLHLGRTRTARWFYLLPPLFAIWVNCHGSFSFGLVLALLTLLTSFVTRPLGAILPYPLSRPARRTLTNCFLFSIAVLLLNPTGIRLVLYPINAVFVPSVSLAAVTEWQPLAFNDFRSFALLAVLAAVLVLPGNTRARIYLHEVALLLPATYLALCHTRLIFPFGIVAAPILARMLATLWGDDSHEQTHPALNAGLVVLGCIAAYVGFPSASALNTQVQTLTPDAAVAYIRSHHLSGPMMNEWIDGGYLIWALPDHPVFIDGRADVYDWAGVTPQYARWATLAEPPNLLLDRYHVQFCLLRKSSPMVNAVGLLPGWHRTYEDPVSVLFERDSASSSSPV